MSENVALLNYCLILVGMFRQILNGLKEVVILGGPVFRTHWLSIKGKNILNRLFRLLFHVSKLSVSETTYWRNDRNSA